MQQKGLDIIFYLVILYVLVAGGWWSYLLYIKNQDALNCKKELLWHRMQDEGVTERQVYLESASYTKLTERYDRQKWMILGEGTVLLFLMILGIWRIAKSRQKEIAIANQQRNFLLSITHELKSPIAAIKLILQTIQKRKLKEAQVKKLTSNALNDTDRLHKLVNDLLLAARVDGGYQYEFEAVNLSAIVQDCIDYYASKYKGSIVFEDTEEAMVLPQADASTLTSVVMNLIGNAIKYAKNSELIRINLNTDKDYCVLEVADNGIGVPKEERESIFEKFYRVGNEDTRKTKGTGLGLYIVKQVVQAHKGQISVRDNQPQGAIFSIKLPLKK